MEIQKNKVYTIDEAAKILRESKNTLYKKVRSGVIRAKRDTKAGSSRWKILGSSMFEYMAGKRPIIATDLPSVREVLNENNAILVKPDDPEGLARGIKEALDDKELTKEIADQAFQDVEEYTWKRRVERIIEFIEIKKE